MAKVIMVGPPPPRGLSAPADSPRRPFWVTHPIARALAKPWRCRRGKGMALPPGIRLESNLADAGVLVVEGDPASRERLARLLATLGIGQVTSVGSAEDAFPLLGLAAPIPETVPIDLVLMEIKLPGLDGIIACSRITSAPAHALTLVMMVTEISLAETLKRAFDAGAVDLIA